MKGHHVPDTADNNVMKHFCCYAGELGGIVADFCHATVETGG